MKVHQVLLLAGSLLGLSSEAVIQSSPTSGAFVAKLHSEVDGKNIKSLFIDMEGLFDEDNNVYQFSNDPDGKDERNK